MNSTACCASNWSATPSAERERPWPSQTTTTGRQPGTTGQGPGPPSPDVPHDTRRFTFHAPRRGAGPGAVARTGAPGAGIRAGVLGNLRAVGRRDRGDVGARAAPVSDVDRRRRRRRRLPRRRLAAGDAEPGPAVATPRARAGDQRRAARLPDAVRLDVAAGADQPLPVLSRAGLDRDVHRLPGTG